MAEKVQRCNVVFAAMVLRGIVGAFLFSAHLLVAQRVEVGVEGGIRTTDDFFSTGAFSFASESKRYIVGPTVDIGLPKRFSVEVDALYQRFGFTEVYSIGIGNYGTVRERTNSWEFPLILKYRLPVKRLHPFVGIGYAPRIVHGTDAGSSETAGCFCYTSGHGTTNYPVMQGMVVSAGVSLRAGHFRFTPEIRYTIWTNLNAYQWVPDETSVLLGIRWR
jgi:hypothetical protein